MSLQSFPTIIFFVCDSKVLWERMRTRGGLRREGVRLLCYEETVTGFKNPFRL